MKVTVLSKEKFDEAMELYAITNENVESFTNHCFISINDYEGSAYKPWFENKSNVKVMFFGDLDDSNDIEIPVDGKTVTINGFKEEHAIELLEFIERNKDAGNFIIHCAAGISRSGAIGTFINDYFSLNYFDFKKRNPSVQPNAHMLCLLNRLIR